MKSCLFFFLRACFDLIYHPHGPLAAVSQSPSNYGYFDILGGLSLQSNLLTLSVTASSRSCNPVDVLRNNNGSPVIHSSRLFKYTTSSNLSYSIRRCVVTVNLEFLCHGLSHTAIFDLRPNNFKLATLPSPNTSKLLLAAVVLQFKILYRW